MANDQMNEEHCGCKPRPCVDWDDIDESACRIRAVEAERDALKAEDDPCVIFMGHYIGCGPCRDTLEKSYRNDIREWREALLELSAAATKVVHLDSHNNCGKYAEHPNPNHCPVCGLEFYLRFARKVLGAKSVSCPTDIVEEE